MGLPTNRSLAGKAVLITGAGTGIGRATALAYAEAGASLAICGRRLPLLEETATAARAFDVPVRVSALDVARSRTRWKPGWPTPAKRTAESTCC